MSAEVQVVDDESLQVVGGGTITYVDCFSPAEFAPPEEEEDLFAATLEGAGDVRLSSLREGLLGWRHKRNGDPARRINMAFADAPEEGFNPFLAIEEDLGPPVLLLAGERLLIRVETNASGESELEPIRSLLSPLLERHEASYEEVGLGVYGTLTIDWSIEERTAAEALRFHDEAAALLLAAWSGELTPSTVLDLLRAGRWDLLTDQPESDWLDAKGAPYLNRDEITKHEFARDVAAFANSPRGGLIVIGMTTRKEGDAELLDDPKEFELDRVDRQQYRDLIEEYVYPLLSGLEVVHLEGKTPGCGLAALLVPRQPKEKLPFLVKGALIEGKLKGKYVLIPTRHGDKTVSMDAASIHARLCLGEQAMSRERQP